MVNALSNGVWKKALKQLVSSVCAVLIVNLTDPKGMVLSKEWLFHVIYAIVTLAVLTEAKYWKAWAEGNGGNGAS
jgi:hypothetical protein